MHATIPDDADPDEVERLRHLQQGAAYGEEHLDELRERGIDYAVVDGDTIVGEGTTPDEAWEDAAGSGADTSRCILVTVPDEGASYFL